MAKLHEIELSEILAELPEIREMNSQLDANRRDELFVCALGFEERCLSVPSSLAENGYRCAVAVCATVATNRDDNNRNRGELFQLLSLMANQVVEVEADETWFSNRLIEVLDTLVPGGRVTFDISTAANRLLMKAMKVLLETDIDLMVMYSEAKTYRPTRAEFEDNPDEWRNLEAGGLEHGVRDVVVSPDHPGMQMDKLPDCVVLFPSFKPGRSLGVIDRVDPSLVANPGKKVIWFLGVPHEPEDEWRLEAMKQINGIENVHHQVSTFDYQETIVHLENVYNVFAQEHNVTVSPIGSKMQALGTSLFHQIHPDVRIVLAVPKKYDARDYSTGCKAKWTIDFGSTVSLRELLSRVGQLRIEEE